jgi:hypothetical protein
MEEITETQTSDTFEPGEEKQGLSTAAKIGIGVGVVVGLVVILIVVGFMLDNPDTTATLRDMFIIVLAFQSLVIGTVLLILVYQLITLTRMLRDELIPMIESTQETLNTVKGTATFVSQRVTKPAIKASGYIAGIGRSIGVVVAMLPRRRGSDSGPALDDEASFDR